MELQQMLRRLGGALLALLLLSAPVAAKHLKGGFGGVPPGTPQAIASVQLSNSTFPVNGVSAVNVGVATATMSPTLPNFAGTLAMTNPAVTGCGDSGLFQLVVNPSATAGPVLQALSTTVAGTYTHVCITPTATGVTGSGTPFTLAPIIGTGGGSAPAAALSASPTAITLGGSSTLTWSSSNATSCTGSGSTFSTGGATSGSQSVSPTVTTTYGLSCTGAGGTATASASVTLRPTATLAASPTTITQGSSSNLSWSSTNATSCTGSGGAFNTGGATSGTQSVSPSVTTGYGLSCTGPDGTANASATVTVTGGATPTASLSASPTSIAPGASSTLTWSSTNATGCSSSGGTFNTGGATSGSQSVSPVATTGYSVTCTGSGGTATASATVTVSGGSPISACVGGSTSGACILAPDHTNTLTDSAGHVWSFSSTPGDNIGPGFPGYTIVLRDGLISCCNAQGLSVFGGSDGGGFSTMLQLDANLHIRSQGWLGAWHQTDNNSLYSPNPGVLPQFPASLGWTYHPSRIVLAADPAWITKNTSDPAVSIGIGAPTSIWDTGANGFALANLTITADTLPPAICGIVTLADGTTAVTQGQTLTSGQLTGLKFVPSTTTLNYTRQCSFIYTVYDPALSPKMGAANFSILPTGLWADPPGAAVGGGGIDAAPTVLQPAVSGDIVGKRFTNPAGEAVGQITRAQFFLMGTVQPSDTLCGKPNGGSCSVYVQKDNINTWPDGSVKMALLSHQKPSFTSSPGYIEIMYAKCSGGGCPAAPAAPLSAVALQASGYNPAVVFNFTSGGTGSQTGNCNAILASAIANGTLKTAYSGNVMAEYRAQGSADSGQLTITCVMRVYTGGATDTDYVVDNSHHFIGGGFGGNDIAYYATFSDSYAFSGEPNGIGCPGANCTNWIYHTKYAMWHHRFQSVGIASTTNVQIDVPYLMATGALNFYDITLGTSDAHIQDQWNNACGSNCGQTVATRDVPMTHGQITQGMGAGGGRPDIGPQPNWSALWLLSQNLQAYQSMIMGANAISSAPWSHFDASDAIPDGFAFDGLAPIITTGGWDLSTQGTAHVPDPSYLPWIVTGDYYNLLNLKTETNFLLWSSRTRFDSNSLDYNGYVNTALAGVTDNEANLSFSGKSNLQPRNIGWYLKEGQETAFTIPDNDPQKSYFTVIAQKAYQGLMQIYAANPWTDAQYGETKGTLGASTVGNGFSNFEQNYIQTSAGVAAQMGLPGVSAYALRLAKYLNRFEAGKIVNGRNGMDPQLSQYYYTPVNANVRTDGGLSAPPDGPGAQPPLQTWAAFFRNSLSAQNGNPADGVPGFRPEITQFHGYITPGVGESTLVVTGLDSPNRISHGSTLLVGAGIPKDTYIWDDGSGGGGVGTYLINKSSLTVASAGFPISITGYTALINGHAVDQFGASGAGWIGGYPAEAKGGFGSILSSYPNYGAFQSYAYVRGYIQRAYFLDPGALTDDTISLQYAPMWNIVPKMPNGQWMFRNHEQFDVANGAAATLTSTVCNSMLAVVGNGTITLNGANNQAGCTDIMEATSVPGGSPLAATMTGGGTNGADAQMYGGCGATTFHFGSGKNMAAIGATCYTGEPGDDTFHASTTALSATQVIQIDTDTTQPQQVGYQQDGDMLLPGMLIGTFRPGTDILQIKSSLNGRSYASSADFMTHCSVVVGDTVCDLGSGSILTVNGAKLTNVTIIP